MVDADVAETIICCARFVLHAVLSSIVSREHLLLTGPHRLGINVMGCVDHWQMSNGG